MTTSSGIFFSAGKETYTYERTKDIVGVLSKGVSYFQNVLPSVIRQWTPGINKFADELDRTSGIFNFCDLFDHSYTLYNRIYNPKEKTTGLHTQQDRILSIVKDVLTVLWDLTCILIFCHSFLFLAGVGKGSLSLFAEVLNLTFCVIVLFRTLQKTTKTQMDNTNPKLSKPLQKANEIRLKKLFSKSIKTIYSIAISLIALLAFGYSGAAVLTAYPGYILLTDALSLFLEGGYHFATVFWKDQEKNLRALSA